MHCSKSLAGREFHPNGDVAVIKSNEGTTQGDPPAGGWYALSTVPIIEHLKSIEYCSVAQAWFAADSSAGGKEMSSKCGRNFSA